MKPRTVSGAGQEPAPEALRRMARGFLCCFWGIPLSLIFLFRTVHIDARVTLLFPPYVIGVLLMLCGVWSLRQAGTVTAAWQTRVRHTLAALLLLLYFAPFVRWWLRMPYHPYLLANMLIFICAWLYVLMLFGRLTEEAAAAFGCRTFRTEAECYGWSVVGLMILPFLGFFMVALHGALRTRSNLYLEMLRLRQSLAAAWLIVPLLPVSLLMNACWKAKTLALDSLLKKAAPGESMASPMGSVGPGTGLIPDVTHEE